MQKKIIISLFSCLLLTSCSNDVKSSLGLRKPAPDEFAVISYPSLSVPPDFRLQEPGFTETYRRSEDVTMPLDSFNKNTAALSEQDRQFLNAFNSGNENTISNVYEDIDYEYNKKKREEEEKGVIRKTMSKLRGENKDKVIDPVAERERIQTNRKEGKPINEGEVKNKSKSTIEQIFD
jgi:hypothetical protein